MHSHLDYVASFAHAEHEHMRARMGAHHHANGHAYTAAGSFYTAEAERLRTMPLDRAMALTPADQLARYRACLERAGDHDRAVFAAEVARLEKLAGA